jgi:hypothetical protein
MRLAIVEHVSVKFNFSSTRKSIAIKSFSSILDITYSFDNDDDFLQGK